MTTEEGAQLLALRAYRFARIAWVFGAAALVGAALAVLWAQSVLFGYIGGLEAGAAVACVVGLVAWLVRRAVRIILIPLRVRWIEEVAHSEGLDAHTLASAFTLDAW